MNEITSSNLESVGRKRVAGVPKRVRKNTGKRKSLCWKKFSVKK
jgi:hypothetical protein